LLGHGQWFSPGTPASSTTKTGRHDIAEILLKVGLNNKNQSNQSFVITMMRSPKHTSSALKRGEVNIMTSQTNGYVNHLNMTNIALNTINLNLNQNKRVVYIQFMTI
jgi:hypothetical protein